MRAAVLSQGRLVVRDDVAEPRPGFGQVLVAVKACGICGSDLHFARHGAAMIELGSRMEGGGGGMRPDLARDVFMGHEFAAEVLEYGPDTVGPAPGATVTSMPVMLTPTGARDLVYSNDLPCGYSERMLLSAALLLEVPNGIDAERAALTEPMAVGVHAVNRSGIAAGEGAVVIGAGPVGLAVVAALRARGAEPVVAADFSPTRRALAAAMGAHETVDAGREGPFDAWRRLQGERPVVAFEAVGAPGMLDETFRAAPAASRVVVVGVCMQPDRLTPFFGVAKELSVQFVLGYQPDEFAGTLTAIAEGDLDVAPLITGRVDLDGVPGAFAELEHPDRHAKILVLP